MTDPLPILFSYIIKGLLISFSLSATSGITLNREIFTPQQKTVVNNTAREVYSEITKTDGDVPKQENVLGSSIENEDQGPISPSPTLFNSQTPSKAPSIIQKPKSSIPTSQPILKDPAEEIMDEINNYRTSLGLKLFQSNPSVCAFAKTRAIEIMSDFSHKGFDSRYQNNSLPYPTMSKVSENIANTSQYTKVFSMWKNSPGHNKNLLSDSPYACVAKSSNFYAFASWTP